MKSRFIIVFAVIVLAVIPGCPSNPAKSPVEYCQWLLNPGFVPPREWSKDRLAAERKRCHPDFFSSPKGLMRPTIINARPSVPYRPFTIEELRDLAAKKGVDKYSFKANENPDGAGWNPETHAEYKWDDYLAHLNKFEAFLNQHGHSLRDSENDVELFQTKIDAPRIARIEGPSADERLASRGPLIFGQVANESKYMTVSETGERESIWGRVVLERAFRGTVDEYSALSGMKLEASLAGVHIDIAHAQAYATIPRDRNRRPYTALVDSGGIVNGGIQSELSRNGEDKVFASQSIGKDNEAESAYPIQLWVGPIPVIVRMGVRARASFVSQASAIETQGVQTTISPEAYVGAFIDAGVGLEWFRVSAGGAVSLLDAKLEQKSPFAFKRGDPESCVDWTPSYRYSVSTLGSQFYLEISVWVPVLGTKTYRWVFLTVPGLIGTEQAKSDPPRRECFGAKCQGAGFSGFLCNGACKNLYEDGQNCGKCGRSCDAGAVCISADCYPPVVTEGALSWSWRGPIAGKTCRRIYVDGAGSGWDDNYLCIDGGRLDWYPSGHTPGADEACTSFANSKAPAWNDAMMCWGARPKPGGAVVLHSRSVLYDDGTQAGTHCLRVAEPLDKAWHETFLCW